MSYDDIVAVFMTTPATPIASPAVPSTPARRLRDALEPIATQGWWSRQAAERVTALGLRFFDGYVWGRAASLGEPASSVVAATFGVFEPAMIGAVYEQGRAAASRSDVLEARATGAAESLAAMASADEATAIAEPLLTALAGVDGMGRPLFSALRELPLPSSAHGRLWRAAELVREHRGDGHLAAAVAAGYDMFTLNVLTELWLGFGLGEYSGTRGLDADRLAAVMADLEQRGLAAGGVLTEIGREARELLEQQTDASQVHLVAALGDEIERITADAEVIAQRILDAGAFPTDPRKRAGG
ncbi:MAG: hypothetical protein JWM12_3680 [Ilumatobacteraceae bacterium]|nr:hypothetical protein [Ilumatobacteraceae bacterium]